VLQALTAGLVCTALLLAGDVNSAPPTLPGSPDQPLPVTTVKAQVPSDRDLLRALAAQSKGHFDDPAESVYQNIQVLKGQSVLAVLNIMDRGYNRSLGVSCSYCHDTKDWASDTKAEKVIARRMSAMVHDINEKYLASIDGLKSQKPVVNCTTCHRGQEKPALDLVPIPPPSH
jgi:hypothetical protein